MAREKASRETLETRDEARPVRGRELRGNIYSPLHAVGLGLLLITMAALVLAQFKGVTDPRADFIRVRPYVAIGYGVLLIVGSCLIVSVLMVRNRRMIIGADRLQLIGGRGRVLGQIPYDNIVDAQRGYTGLEVAIVLDKLRRRDTWWPGLGKPRYCSVEIGPGLEADPTGILLYLRDATQAYWDQRGGSPWEQR